MIFHNLFRMTNLKGVLPCHQNVQKDYFGFYPCQPYHRLPQLNLHGISLFNCDYNSRIVFTMQCSLYFDASRFELLPVETDEDKYSKLFLASNITFFTTEFPLSTAIRRLFIDWFKPDVFICLDPWISIESSSRVLSSEISSFQNQHSSSRSVFGCWA